MVGISLYAPRDMTENADSGSNINTLYPNLMPDVRCSTRAGGVGMKAMGWDDWLINTTLQLFDLYRRGYASRVSSEVQEILGRRPIPFSQFVKDYAQAFR